MTRLLTCIDEHFTMVKLKFLAIEKMTESASTTNESTMTNVNEMINNDDASQHVDDITNELLPEDIQIVDDLPQTIFKVIENMHIEGISCSSSSSDIDLDYDLGSDSEYESSSNLSDINDVNIVMNVNFSLSASTINYINELTDINDEIKNIIISIANNLLVILASSPSYMDDYYKRETKEEILAITSFNVTLTNEIYDIIVKDVYNLLIAHNFRTIV